MKWVGFSLLVLMFPVALWLLTGKSASGDRKAPAVAASSMRSNETTEQDVVDLNGAADQTIKRMAEIDARILATKGELMRHEADRQKMAEELVKIQTKISEVLGRTARVKR
jgi:hypothetical protein